MCVCLLPTVSIPRTRRWLNLHYPFDVNRIGQDRMDVVREQLQLVTRIVVVIRACLVLD